MVGRHGDLGVGPQGRAGLQGLHGEHIQDGPAEPARVKGLEDVGHHHLLAPAQTHEGQGGVAGGQKPAIHQMAGGGGEGRADHQDPGCG